MHSSIKLTDCKETERDRETERERERQRDRERERETESQIVTHKNAPKTWDEPNSVTIFTSKIHQPIYVFYCLCVRVCMCVSVRVCVCWHSILHLCANAHTQNDLQDECSSARGRYGAPLASYSGTKTLGMVLIIRENMLLYEQKGFRGFKLTTKKCNANRKSWVIKG